MGSYNLSMYKSMAKASETHFSFERLNRTQGGASGKTSPVLKSSFRKTSESNRSSPNIIKRQFADAKMSPSSINVTRQTSHSPTSFHNRLGGPGTPVMNQLNFSSRDQREKQFSHPGMGVPGPGSYSTNII